MVLRVEDLDVYQMAEELSDIVWGICIEWDYFAKVTVGKQFVRAVDSISANLAESHGRFHYSDRLNFLYYERGSMEETKAWFSKALRRGLISQREADLKQLMDILPKN